jgi:hypothetical protein
LRNERKWENHNYRLVSFQYIRFLMDIFIMKVLLLVHLLVDKKSDLNTIFLGILLLKLLLVLWVILFNIKWVSLSFVSQKWALGIFIYLLKIIIVLMSLILIVFGLQYHSLHLNFCFWFDLKILIEFIAFSQVKYSFNMKFYLVSSFILILSAYLLFLKLNLLILQLSHLLLFYFR